MLSHFAVLPGFYDTSPEELRDTAFALGISGDFFYSEQTVSSLSGGEKVKLQLASLLIEKPDVLLLDEPSNDIDIDTLEWLEKFINTCGIPVLFVSHDETLIENTANVIIHIEQVRRKTVPRVTVARMSYQDYIGGRNRKIQKQTQLAKKEKADFDSQQERFRQIYSRVEHEQNAISRQDPAGGRLLKKKMKTLKAQEKRFENQKENLTELPDFEEAIMPAFTADADIPGGKIILEFALESLTVEGRLLSKNINLLVRGAEKICIIGKNGAGKTTLLRKIAGDLLKRGDIKAAYMPQNYEDGMDFSLTPVEFLSPDTHKDSMTRARTFLGGMKYTADEMSRKISDLSGGQKAKLFLLKMILDGNNVLLLDEPTRNFSPMSAPVIRDMLAGFTGAVISVSHDRKFIEEVADRVYVLDGSGLFEYDAGLL